MGSWIKCCCGSLLHTNLFAGSGVAFVIPEQLMDTEFSSVDELKDAIILRESRKLLACKNCGRILIENEEGYQSYVPEK
jgi:hypothetical protein